MLFFFVFFFQLIVMIVQSIGKRERERETSSIKSREKCKFGFFLGFSSGGTIGMITAIEQFDGSVGGTLLGIFCLFIAIGFCIASGATFLMLTKVRIICENLFNFFKIFNLLQIHAIYRSSGASMDKGVQEFQREFFRNQTVQQATADLARSAVQSEVNRRY
jgi:secretory carrier-associated membrane protein